MMHLTHTTRTTRGTECSSAGDGFVYQPTETTRRSVRALPSHSHSFTHSHTHTHSHSYTHTGRQSLSRQLWRELQVSASDERRDGDDDDDDNHPGRETNR